MNPRQKRSKMETNEPKTRLKRSKMETNEPKTKEI